MSAPPWRGALLAFVVPFSLVIAIASFVDAPAEVKTPGIIIAGALLLLSTHANYGLRGSTW